MIYQCEVLFKKGPAFSPTVNANCAELAKAEAVNMSRRYGFTYKVKKVTAKAEK
jgi:hypothetical protein